MALGLKKTRTEPVQARRVGWLKYLAGPAILQYTGDFLAHDFSTFRWAKIIWQGHGPRGSNGRYATGFNPGGKEA